MANASRMWQDKLKTAAVLSDGKMFLAMAETDVGNFVHMCRLIHFAGSITRPRTSTMHSLAKLSVKHGCQRAMKGFMFLWFNLYLLGDDLSRRNEWALLQTA